VGSSEESQFKLIIPSVGITKDDTASIRLKIPKEGKLEVNKTIELAGYPVDIESIERTKKDEITLKVNPRYNPQALETLKDFRLDTSKLGGYSSKLNDQTYAIEYFYIPIDKNASSIKLHFNEPYLVRKGPWEITITR